MSRLAARSHAGFIAAICSVAWVLASAPAAHAATTVTVDPGSYTGRYYIPGVIPCCVTGTTTTALADGTYSLDTGASVAGSYGASAFLFSVSGGTVTTSGPSATASGSVLKLANTTVTVKAGSYAGRYFLSSFHTARELTGTQSVVLVPGLVYGLDDGAEIVTTIAGVPTASDFLFVVSGSGAVTIVPGAPSVPATATGAEIDLNSVPLSIYASPTNVPYLVCSQPAGTTYTGNLTVTVIPGLANCVGDGISGSYFVAGPAGVQPASLTAGRLTVVFTAPASNTPATLATTTATLIQGSPAFTALSPAAQAQVSQGLALLTQSLSGVTSLTPAQKAAYSAIVNVLVAASFLTPDQGAALKAFTASL